MRRDTPEPEPRVLPWFGTEILARQVPTPAAAGLDGASSIGFARNWDPSAFRRSAICVDTTRAIVNGQGYLTSRRILCTPGQRRERCGNVNPPSAEPRL